METTTTTKQINGVLFLRSYVEAIENVEENEQLELFKAISYYGLDGIEPTFSKKYLNAIWITIKPNIDAAISRRNIVVENGKKGGRPKKDLPSTPKKEEPKSEVITEPIIIEESKSSITKTQANLIKFLKTKELNEFDEKKYIGYILDESIKTIKELDEYLKYIVI